MQPYKGYAVTFHLPEGMDIFYLKLPIYLFPHTILSPLSQTLTLFSIRRTNICVHNLHIWTKITPKYKMEFLQMANFTLSYSKFLCTHTSVFLSKIHISFPYPLLKPTFYFWRPCLKPQIHYACVNINRYVIETSPPSSIASLSINHTSYFSMAFSRHGAMLKTYYRSCECNSYYNHSKNFTNYYATTKDYLVLHYISCLSVKTKLFKCQISIFTHLHSVQTSLILQLSPILQNVQM